MIVRSEKLTDSAVYPRCDFTHASLVLWYFFVLFLMAYYKPCLNRPANTKESIVQYLWYSEYIGITFVAMKKLCSRYIPVLTSVICIL